MKEMTMKEALETVESLTCAAEILMAKEPETVPATDVLVNRCDIQALNKILAYFAEHADEIE